MKRKLDKLYSESEVTYKGTIFLAVTISSIAVGLHQFFLNLNVHLDFPKVGNLDFITLFGLAVSGISGVFAFQQIKLADLGIRDVRQHAIKDEIIREVDEGKMLTDRLAERLRLATDSLAEKNGMLEREIYSLRLQLEKHADLDLHIGAQKRLSFMEDKLYEIGAALKLLSKSDETLYRISRLEQGLKHLNVEEE
jgi:hypothetical protein